MNIGIFSDTYSPNIDGVSTSISSIKSELERRQHNVFIFAPNDKLLNKSFPKENIYRFPSIKFYGEKRYRATIPFLCDKKFYDLPLDIIHTQTPFFIGNMGLKIAESRHLPIVHTYHTSYMEYAHYLKLPDYLLNPLAKKIIKNIARFINSHNAVIAPSLGIKNYLQTIKITKPISIIPTGINVEKINAMANAKNSREFLEKLNINDNDEIIVFTGRLGKEKNIKFLIYSALSAIKTRQRLKFLIIGDGNEKKNLKNLVQQLKLEQNIIFLGAMNQKDIFPIYKSSDIFIFSSLTETQGIAILEAMATGLPVIALRAKGIEDILIGNQGGFLVEEKNPKAFAKYIISLLENKSLRENKSKEAKNRAYDFSLKKTTDLLLNLYENLTQKETPDKLKSSFFET